MVGVLLLLLLLLVVLVLIPHEEEEAGDEMTRDHTNDVCVLFGSKE